RRGRSCAGAGGRTCDAPMVACGGREGAGVCSPRTVRCLRGTLMNTTPSAARPGWFRVVAVLLLLWNLLGLWMFWSQYTMSPAQLAALPEAQRGLFEAMPGWAWAVYGL